MFNIEIQRLVLLVALGLVLVMIWQSWGEFQAEYTARTAPDDAPSQAYQTPSTTLGNATPSVTTVGDVPDAPALPATPAVATPAETPSIRPGRLINITTDLVRAQIDPQGGDLVRLELLHHPVSVERTDEPFVLMHRDDGGLFVAQSGLIGTGRDYPNHGIAYSAEAFDYDLGPRDVMEVVLRWDAPDGVAYQKVFRFKRDTYRIEVDFRVNNRSQQPWTGFVYGQLKQTEVVQQNSMGFLGRLPSYNGASIYTAEENYEKIDYGDMRDTTLSLDTSAGWVAMMQHYFVSVWLPSGSAGYTFYSGVKNAARPEYRIGYKTTQPVQIAPGNRGVVNTVLFAGPKEQDRLREQNAEGLLLTVDYGWLTPIANPLFWLLNRIHGAVNNWGWSIILLTLLVKAIFYPLSAASYKSMARMRKLSPRLKTLKERYGDDKQKFQQETMKLYKSEKVNPAGGCLPILVQMPVFISLYWVLLESVELRQADFMFWLKDLSIPDPYYVLPLIMGASMLAQHFLNPAPTDPLQKKIMMGMPIVFTVFFLWFPAGLVLYWVVNNLLSIAQQYYITRKFDAL